MDVNRSLANTKSDFLLLSRAMRLWREGERLLKQAMANKYPIYVDGDDGAKTSNWSIDFGTGRVGNEIGSDGLLYVTITDESPGAGQATVDVYSDSAKTDKVMTGSAADGGTVTLSNSGSGNNMTGQVTIGTIAANITDIILRPVQPPWDTSQYVSQSQDTSTEKTWAQLMNDLRAGTRATALNMMRASERMMETIFREHFRKVWKINATALLDRSYDIDSEGAITAVDDQGILGELEDNMSDNTSEVTFAVPTTSTDTTSPYGADADNDGSWSFTGLTGRDNALDGLVEIKCVAGDSATAGRARFELTFQRDDLPGPDGFIRADNPAFITKQYIDDAIGISWTTMARTITETGDTNNDLSGWTISGETDQNTNGGVLYIDFDINNPSGTHVVKVYKASSRTDVDLVAQGSRSGTGTLSFSSANNSGLSGTVSVDSATADNSSIELDLNFASVGDRYLVNLTNSFDGNLMHEIISKAFRKSLPTDATPTITEDFASAGLPVRIDSAD